jgi:DNA-binding response OmpR family regulator
VIEDGRVTIERPQEIFIVDDNPLMARLLTELLEDEGYRAVVLTGDSVLAAARQVPPRLILLDVLLPGIDGPDVCRQLREDPLTASVPIVFISALPPATLALRLQDCPYDALITKPFNIDEVIETIRQLLLPPAR